MLFLRSVFWISSPCQNTEDQQETLGNSVRNCAPVSSPKLLLLHTPCSPASSFHAVYFATPPPIPPDPLQFFGPMKQPKWTPVDVKKVREAPSQTDGRTGIRSMCAIGDHTYFATWYTVFIRFAVAKRRGTGPLFYHGSRS